MTDHAALIERTRLYEAALIRMAEYSEMIATLTAERDALREAVLSVANATRAYLPPDGIDAQECLNRIIGATDNPIINPIIAALEKSDDR